MKLIDLFAMQAETAAMEAAATGQANWLKELIPLLEDQVDTMASKVTDLAATLGHSGVILAAYEWRIATGNTAWVACDYAQSKAAAGGHFDALRCLVALYRAPTLEALKQALDNDHHKIVGLLCEAIECEKSLPWAVENGQLEAVKAIFECHHQDGDIHVADVYQAVLAAVSAGNLPIVQFLNEKFGEELYPERGGAVGGRPLARAIEEGRMEIAKYLYTTHRFPASAFETIFSVAAIYGPIELVELMWSEERCDVSLCRKGFLLAAGGGQSAIMAFFRSKEDIDASGVSEAFVRAAGCGQARIVEQLYASDGHKVLTTIDFNDAAIVASGGGHLEVVKFFDNKGHVTEELGVKMFLCAATDEGLKSVSIADQVGVLEYLFSKGWITVDVIAEFFPEAASCSCVEVVEFLFHTGPLPADVVNDAFEEARCGNCAPVVEFLCKTGEVSSELIEEAFVEAAAENDIYLVETLYNSGCTSPELLKKALRVAHTSDHSIVQLFLSRKKAEHKATE